MTLREWRQDNRMSLAACAALFGVSNGAVVSKWERGLRTPRPKHLKRIHAATAGAVTANDFAGIPESEAA